MIKSPYTNLTILACLLSVSILLGCSESRSKDTPETEGSNAIHFPNIPYTIVKILSIDRDRANYDTDLKRMAYLEGVAATGFIDSTGTLITKKINERLLTEPQITQLKRIFRPVEVNDDEQWTDGDCIPLYQDAIVFYSANAKPVAWANICFTCERTMFYPSSDYMNGFDIRQHSELRDFFKSLGYTPEGRP